MDAFRLILVDDEAELRPIFEMCLGTFKHSEIEFHHFLNGAECMKFLNENKGNFSKTFVISDINMPDKNGIELVEELRAFNETIDVYFCSAYCSDVFVRKAMDLGVKKFFSKPVDYREVIQLIIDQRFAQAS